MGRIFAIGDIHGCLKPFKDLLQRLPINWEEDLVIFLGDYIDRGPRPRAVVEEILRLREENPQRIITLMGNHEWMFLRYLRGKDIEIYLFNGGQTTIADYGDQAPPPEHLHFFETLRPFYETEDYIFVHAGLRPGKDLWEQELKDLLWIRGEFIWSDFDFGKRIIFGHTPFSEPLIMANKVGLDTGCVYGGRLTAVVLPEMDFYYSFCTKEGGRYGSL